MGALFIVPALTSFPLALPAAEVRKVVDYRDDCRHAFTRRKSSAN